MKRIFSRAFRGYLLVVLILTVLTPLVLYQTLRSRMTNSAYGDLERTAKALKPSFEKLALDPSSYGRLDSLAKALGPELGVRITVIRSDGTVIGDSDADPEELESHRTREEVIKALRGGTGRSSRLSESVGRNMLYAAVPLQAGDSIPVVLRTSLYFSQFREATKEMAANIAIIAGGALLAGMLAAWVFSRRLTDPIKRMASVASSVRSGDFTARAEPCDTAELQELAVSINDMIARTESLIEELSTQNNQSRAILRSIGEGLVVVGPSGRVLMANREFVSMACSSDPVGKSFREAITNPGVSSFIAEGMESGIREDRIEVGGRTYACSVARAGESNRKVFTFRDVTQLANLAKIKRDFATNVSHELRTPLTAIKGFTETLWSDASEEQREYLGTIRRNTDRLINLVRDVQILSETEDPATRLEIEKVDVEEMLRSVVPLFTDRAGEKGLDLSVDIRGRMPPVSGDRFRLEQVLVNLVDNAVKYTDKGGVTIRVEARGNYVVIAVADTGPGIPRDIQPRLFERFFVVDKARSRQTGGTGLGLAIVKHIMSLHGGWARVNSTPGSGSIFSVAVPVWSAPDGEADRQKA